jgi:gliding motility-associated-like protein
LEVFDRWGNKVFSSTNKNNRWNGSVNGVKVATGVYPVVVEVKYISGTIETKNSSVTVTR